MLSQFNDFDCVVIAAIISSNTRVTYCSLRDSDIGAIGCKALGEALASNASLTSLDLRGERMLRDGSGKRQLGEALLASHTSQLAFFACDSWTLSPDTTTLDLTDRAFGDEDVLLLGGVLKRNATLTSLRLSGNPGMNHDSVRGLAEALFLNSRLFK